MPHRPSFSFSFSRTFEMKTISAILVLVGVVLAVPVDKSPKVVGGRDAREHEAPYIVSLQVDRAGSGSFSHVCGGSILTEIWILSAAHCITEVGLTLDYQIVAGQHDLAAVSGTEQERRVSDFHLHESFVSGPVVGPFDVVVLRLESPLTFVTGVVEAINLPPAGRIFTGDVTLFGWGSTSYTTTPSWPNILQTVTKPVIEWEICREIVNAVFAHEPLHSSNLCTGPLDTIESACNG